jgi:hypothetical protein
MINFSMLADQAQGLSDRARSSAVAAILDAAMESVDQ